MHKECSRMVKVVHLCKNTCRRKYNKKYHDKFFGNSENDDGMDSFGFRHSSGFGSGYGSGEGNRYLMGDGSGKAYGRGEGYRDSGHPRGMPCGYGSSQFTDSNPFLLEYGWGIYEWKMLK